jgi:hypothetical protein
MSPKSPREMMDAINRNLPKKWLKAAYQHDEETKK